MTYFTTFASPIGDLTLAGSGGAVTGLYFSTGPKAQTAHPTWQRDESKLAEVVAQLQGQQDTYEKKAKGMWSQLQKATDENKDLEAAGKEMGRELDDALKELDRQKVGRCGRCGRCGRWVGG